jgi:hypothetical protein
VSLTITAGVPGLEGEHTWNGGIVLGREFGTPKLPRYKVTKWTGLHSLPESDDNRDKNTSRAGETIWPSFARGKTVIPTGVIQASDLEEMRVATAYMRGQFANRSDEGQMISEAVAHLDGIPWSWNARVLALDIDDEVKRGPGAQPTPWEREFMLSLRMSDARFYDWSDLGLATDSGPFLDYGAGGGAAVTHLVVNEGNADSDPVITGTCTAGGEVAMWNAAFNASDGNPPRLHFDNLEPGELEVNFRAKSATLTPIGDDPEEVSQLLLADSSWWDELIPGLIPGNNLVAVEGLDNWHVLHYNTSW